MHQTNVIQNDENAELENNVENVENDNRDLSRQDVYETSEDFLKDVLNEFDPGTYKMYVVPNIPSKILLNLPNAYSNYMRQKYPLRSSLVWFDNAGYSNYGWMNHPTRNSGSFNAGYQRFCFWKIDDSRLPSKLRCVTDEVRDFFNDNVPF